MKDFAAIDFETANCERSSVCSVGVVIYRDGEMVDEFYSLIKPEPEYYNYWCSQVHGLTAADTENAQVFPFVWEKVEALLYTHGIEGINSMNGERGLPLVAHNKAFDESCLKAVFRVYQMDYPDYEFYCTLQKSRKVWPGGHHNLDIIAERCGYILENHHNALADAEACAIIAKEIL